MKIRGNKGGAETTFLASYFLPNKPSNKTIAQKINKNPKIPIRFFIIDSSSTIAVNFTIDT